MHETHKEGHERASMANLIAQLQKILYRSSDLAKKRLFTNSLSIVVLLLQAACVFQKKVTIPFNLYNLLHESSVSLEHNSKK